MMELMIRQNEMNNRQIKRAGVDGIINKKLLPNISTRGAIPRKFPYPLLSGSLYNGTVYMFL